MAKDDYFVIVYRILKYFYECFKLGEMPERDMFSPDALGINNGYWVNVIESLVDEGHISGVSVIGYLGGSKGVKLIEPKITPKGIEFLQENSALAKAKNMLKAAKDIIPGI